jgi:hypothetical protein
MKLFFARRKSVKEKREEASPPQWFERRSDLRIEGSPHSSPLFLYQSWIPQHTDKIVDALRQRSTFFKDLKMFNDPSDKSQRVEILRFAEDNPDYYRRMALHKLAPYRGIASGLVVTLDWIPAMRHLVYAASQIGLPTILVPHESVFAKQSMYYVHPRLKIDLPACDIVCAWGDLQESIFIERGYPSHRIVKTGSPKFDYIERVRASNDRSALRVLGLEPSLPVITFVAQPLDSQYDQKEARLAQENALRGLVSWASGRAQIIVRMPPSRDEVFTPQLIDEITRSSNMRVDRADLYLLTPEETIEVSDVVVSVNSTMLLEAALCGRAAISCKFLEFEQIWDGLKIPVASDSRELTVALELALSSRDEIINRYDYRWAANAFSNGAFDGGAANRISSVLSDIALTKHTFPLGFAKTTPFRPDSMF